MMSEPILKIENLHVVYKTDESTVYAVNGVDLELFSGETLGLVGETGAGKTTTALSIMRLLPDKIGKVVQGSITLEGTDVLAATEADMRLLRGSTVSMIFQDPMTSLNPTITVGNQIGEVLYLHRPGISHADIEAGVDNILEMVGIPAGRKNDYPHQFSGGMKQRIVIAIALACEPKLLLADEPTTALDVTIQAQVLEMMNELKDKLDTSMILITHDLGVVAQTCDKVAIMYAGEIVEYGTAEDVFNGKNKHPYTKGLFGSIPDLTKKAYRLSPIEGLMPDPTDLPAGCKFHDRCPYCMDICRTQDAPAMREGSHTTRRIFEYGLLCMTPILAFSELNFDMSKLCNSVNMLNLLFLGICASALCFVTWNTAIGILGPVKTTTYIYIIPVISVAASAVILHERITALAAAGMALIIAGLVLSGKEGTSGAKHKPNKWEKKHEN